jgi:hypothetical protein
MADVVTAYRDADLTNCQDTTERSLKWVRRAPSPFANDAQCPAVDISVTARLGPAHESDDRSGECQT